MTDLFNLILIPLAWLLRTLYFTFHDYGVAIIVFCLVSKVILFPLSVKGKKSMVRMSAISAQQQVIQKKYAGDKMKTNQEIQKLYEREKVNPMGGCLWSLLPLPILIALYSVIRRPLYYMMGLTTDEINELSNFLFGEVISAANTGEITIAEGLFRQYDAVKAALPQIGEKIFELDFSFLGLNLGTIPQWNIFGYEVHSWATVGLFLLPILSALVAYLSMKFSLKTNSAGAPPLEGAAASTNKSMTFMMPIISLWIGYTLPASLCVYWISNSLFMIVQEWTASKLIRKDIEAVAAQRAEREKKELADEEERKRRATERRARALAEKNQNKQKKKGKPQGDRGPSAGEIQDASRVGMRAYARGRAYDPNRYPVTPYRDPDLEMPEEEKPAEPLAEPERDILPEEAVSNAAYYDGTDDEGDIKPIDPLAAMMAPRLEAPAEGADEDQADRDDEEAPDGAAWEDTEGEDDDTEDDDTDGDDWKE